MSDEVAPQIEAKRRMTAIEVYDALKKADERPQLNDEQKRELDEELAGVPTSKLLMLMFSDEAGKAMIDHILEQEYTADERAAIPAVLGYFDEAVASLVDRRLSTASLNEEIEDLRRRVRRLEMTGTRSGSRGEP